MVPEECDPKGQINSGGRFKEERVCWLLGRHPPSGPRLGTGDRGQEIGCGARLGWDLGVLSMDYVGLALVSW